jgi:UDPglucose--hexose-1-phosphate uridylyltransferase
LSCFRQDPIRGHWVAISEARAARPNEFSGDSGPCPFCRGNEAETPPELLRYPSPDGSSWRLRVFPNKYPAITQECGGAHEVIVESPEHISSFGQVPVAAAIDLLRAARDRMLVLKRDARIQYIQFFSNNGPGAGASREHVHAQLIGIPEIPEQVRLELQRYSEAGACLLCEPSHQNRLVHQDNEVLIVAPYAPRVAFETWVVPRRHASHFERAPETSIDAVATALHRLIQCLGALVPGTSYNFLLSTAPLQTEPLAYYHWRIEVLPRVTGIGGYEFGTGCYINSITPEESAASLRQLLAGLNRSPSANIVF